MNIQRRIIACIVLFSLVPQVVLVTVFYQRNLERLVETTKDSIYYRVAVNNDWLNEQLYLLNEASKNILVDDFLYSVFSGEEGVLRGYVDNEATSRKITQNVSKTLFSYFGNNRLVVQVEIATRDDCIAMYSQKTDYDRFWTSEVYREIEARQGGIVWLGRAEMAPFAVETQYLSCARLLNLRRVTDSSIGYFLPEGVERPVLRVMLSDDLISEQLRRAIEGIDGAQCGLIDDSGRVLLGGGELREILSESALRAISGRDTGAVEVLARNGERAVICFDRLEEAGWISVAAFSIDTLAQPLEGQLRGMYLGIVIAQVLTLLFTAVLATGIMRARIRQLGAAVKEVAGGNFAARIYDDRRDEFSGLVQDFNGMSRQLERLVDENMRISLQEQEARLQTLMMQLNPHYIYNSLNVVNWIALGEGARRTSALVVALSRMLRYTSNNQQAFTRLGDDLEWMRDYFKMMDARFAGLYRVEWDIDERTLDLALPKLFLQPLVENCILHGFAGRTEGGRIRIRVWLEGGDALGEVEDNGCGMDPARVPDLLSGRAGRVGLSNVHRRIVQCYGEGYGLSVRTAPGEGVCVRVRMRASNDKPTADENSR